MYIIIGLTGKKQTGKDTVFKLTFKLLRPPNRVLRLAFADAVKEEVACACGVTVKFIEENKELFRPILQWWGTDFKRKLYGDSYWIDKLCKKVIALSDSSEKYLTLVIITDVRFINEAEFIKFCNGYTVKVVRPISSTSHVDKHISETELDSIKPDYIIDNSNGLHTLEQITNDVITTIVKNHKIVNVEV